MTEKALLCSALSRDVLVDTDPLCFESLTDDSMLTQQLRHGFVKCAMLVPLSASDSRKKSICSWTVIGRRRKHQGRIAALQRRCASAHRHD
jgi:hypothetical protein